MAAKWAMKKNKFSSESVVFKNFSGISYPGQKLNFEQGRIKKMKMWVNGEKEKEMKKRRGRMEIYRGEIRNQPGVRPIND